MGCSDEGSGLELDRARSEQVQAFLAKKLKHKAQGKLLSV